MLLFNRYEYNPQTDLIGKGGFSRVYRATDKKLNRKVALKVYKSSELAEKYSPISEIQRVIEFDHPNISRYIDIDEFEKEDAFGEKETVQVCVMELLDGGNLAQFHQQNQDLAVLRKLLEDVLNGLSYLHQNGVIHRDIKPANILIKNTVKGPMAKITDFGISKRSDSSFNSTSSALIVSIPYMAPEQLNPQKYGIEEKVAFNIDLWALGVTVFEIIAGEMLFRNNASESSEQIMANIMTSDLPEKIKKLPQPFRNFVECCVVKDAKVRIKSAEDLVEILQQHEQVKVSKPAQLLEVIPQAVPVEAAGAPDDTIEIAAPPDFANADDDATQVLKKTEIPVIEEHDEIETVVLGKLPQLPETDTADLAGSRVPQINKQPVILEQPAIKEQQAVREKPVNLFNRYDYYPVSDLIGKGGFSRVYKAYDKKLSRWVALKIYKTGEFSESYSPIAEIKRVVNLDHPNICRYFDIEEIQKENPFGENEIIQVCVMELLDGGNFAEYYRKNQNIAVFRSLLRDILNGLAYLHRQGIIHRDIKPANILIKSTLEGPVAKITDFGISKAFDNVNSHSTSALVVSIPYMAPEQLNIKRYGINEKVSYNLDLWSLGVTIYEIITGKVLFKNSDEDSSEQIMMNIMAPGIPEKINELQEPFRQIVAQCIVKSAANRIKSAEELLKYLDAPQGQSPVKIPESTPIPNPAPPKIPSPFFAGEEEADQQRKPRQNFMQQHSLKIIIGLVALLILVPVLIFVKFSTPASTDNAMQNQASTDTVSIVEQAPIDSNAISNVVPDEKPAPQIVKETQKETPPPASNKPITLHISSSRDCSIKIVGQDINFQDALPDVLRKADISIDLYPGTYVITATSPDGAVSTGKIVVTASLAGRRNTFTVPWD